MATKQVVLQGRLKDGVPTPMSKHNPQQSFQSFQHKSQVQDSQDTLELPLDSPSSAPAHTTLRPSHPIVTRSKADIFKPKVYLSKAQWRVVQEEPSTVEEALRHIDWNITMTDEFKAQVRNKTWTLVPPSLDYNVVGNKWVLKIKYNIDGSF
uniref:Mitochondrial protein n=1 Tax=Cannabis sativa TaxID=3483 RepID=A0A803QFB8_CANSA